MPSRFTVFDPDAIFLDRDQDGIVDTVDLQIHLRRGCETPSVLCAVLDLCAAIGFETAAMDLPLVTARAEEARAVRYHLHIGLGDALRRDRLKGTGRRTVVSAEDPKGLEAAIRLIAAPVAMRGAMPQGGLSARSSTRVTDSHHSASRLAEVFTRFPYKIVVLDVPDLRVAAEAANLAARLGLEALSLSYPLACPWSGAFRGDEPRIYIGRRRDVTRIPGFSTAISFVAERESGVLLGPADVGVPDIFLYGDGQGLHRVLRFVSRFPMDTESWETPWLRRLVGDLHARFRSAARRARRSPPRHQVWGFSVRDEREETLALLRRGLATRPPASSIAVEIAIARPLTARQRLANTVRACMAEHALAQSAVQVRVLNAYKPGLSWLTEVVGLELLETGVDRIEIAFQGFRERGLEERLRWLQEIHPADEILSQRLGIAKDRIGFVRDDRLDTVYRVRAWRRTRRVYERRYSPRWNGRLYLDAFPRGGRVHPTTGGVRLVVDGVEVVNQSVKTPAERIWDIYQQQVLPALAEEAEAVLFKPDDTATPLFEELRFDLWLDYPAERLGIGEERVSPLEALHEDLYFVTLDFFARWLERQGQGGRSSGRILPVIHPNYRGAGARLRATLVHRRPDPLGAPLRDVPRIRLAGLFPRGKRLEVGLAVTPASSPPARRRCEARLHSAPQIVKVLKTRPASDAIHAIASVPWAKRAAARRQPLSIPLDRPLGYADGVKFIRSFAGVPSVRVIEEGESFQGVPIFSLELTHPGPSACVSHLKRRLFKPTVFINCRHHANEVSSTNAALELARLLATIPRYRRLLRGVNVVVNPMENVDGVLALEELMRLTPTDKLHAARYNAAGKEYYGEYFIPEPRYGEAKVKPAIWRRWLPDICIDSHGFPSHEWEQPFSGYAPVKFREFWIPRALIYAYLPHLEAREGSAARSNAEFLKAWLARSLSEDRRMCDANARFGERYWKYREAWMGRTRAPHSPVPCLPLSERLRKTNYAYRFPGITTVDLITEVADETAWGPCLRDCISAHLQIDLALIRLLNHLRIRAKKFTHQQDQEIRCFWHRDRPLVFQ